MVKVQFGFGVSSLMVTVQAGKCVLLILVLRKYKPV